MDWNAFKACLFESAKTKLEALLCQEVEPLYAVVFFASYREQEGVIGLPSLAANNLTMLDEEHPRWQRKGKGFWSTKWTPEDWH